jgi:ketosteroid isomerase-like protein
MSQENVEILRRGFEAFAQGDVEAVLDLVDADIEWSAALAPILGVTAVSGKVALRKFLVQDLQDGFEDFRAEPLSFEDHGDTVLVLVRYSGRGKASGVEIGQAFHTIYVFRNGTVVKMHDYPTKTEALEAAGLKG